MQRSAKALPWRCLYFARAIFQDSQGMALALQSDYSAAAAGVAGVAAVLIVSFSRIRAALPLRLRR